VYAMLRHSAANNGTNHLDADFIWNSPCESWRSGAEWLACAAQRHPCQAWL